MRQIPIRITILEEVRRRLALLHYQIRYTDGISIRPQFFYVVHGKNHQIFDFSSSHSGECFLKYLKEAQWCRMGTGRTRSLLDLPRLRLAPLECSRHELWCCPSQHPLSSFGQVMYLSSTISKSSEQIVALGQLWMSSTPEQQKPAL